MLLLSELEQVKVVVELVFFRLHLLHLAGKVAGATTSGRSRFTFRGRLVRLLSSGAESCPVELRSENVSCVTVCLGVTVLLFEITVATVIKNSKKNMNG